MTFKNNLCLDSKCNGPSGCVHRGPKGEFCYFYAEQQLCSLLGIEWEPKFDLDTLLCKVRDKLPSLNDHIPALAVDDKEPEA